MSEFVVGMGKINNRVGLFSSRGPLLHVWRWCGGKESQLFFFNQGPASLKIFIHYFSLSASKIYLGIEELTSNSAVKINPLLLRCTLFDKKQPRIQACFTSIDYFTKRVKNNTDAFLKAGGYHILQSKPQQPCCTARFEYSTSVFHLKKAANWFVSVTFQHSILTSVSWQNCKARLISNPHTGFLSGQNVSEKKHFQSGKTE